jgi:hypothetical protein
MSAAAVTRPSPVRGDLIARARSKWHRRQSISVAIVCGRCLTRGGVNVEPPAVQLGELVLAAVAENA